MRMTPSFAQIALIAAGYTLQMAVFVAIAGVLLISVVFADIFATIIEPRTVERPFSLTAIYYAYAWKLTRFFARVVRAMPGKRESLLSKFGPASLLVLIILWSGLLILGFSSVLFGLGVPLSRPEETGFGSYFYMSAVTFFTLGYGDMTAVSAVGRTVAIIEAGTGFGMLAVVISYIPVFYQAFSRRESTALLLDARAGSPPSGGELLLRYSGRASGDLTRVFEEFEKWCANLLESFLSYPMLAMYRSQHEKLSWLACLTAILDATALVQTSYGDTDSECKQLKRQAELTFAMARHLAVDLAFILNIEPKHSGQDRLPAAEFEKLVAQLKEHETNISPDALTKLNMLRRKYEPYLFSLSKALILALPPWIPGEHARDSWETTAWDEDGHF